MKYNKTKIKNKVFKLASLTVNKLKINHLINKER